MRILLVEDDKTLAEGLSYSLEREGFHVAAAGGVLQAGELLEKETFGMALLDLSLPDGSGYEICRRIKEEGDMPVLFLTACDEEVNVVMGLDMGADDYITKPFRLRELLSRMKSVARRYERQQRAAASGEHTPQGEEPDFLLPGDLAVYTRKARVTKRGEDIPLTALEYRLLLTFANHRGQVLSRNRLLESIWDVSGDFVNDNTLTVYIKRLREKLEDDPSRPAVICTVRGFGYQLGE